MAVRMREVLARPLVYSWVCVCVPLALSLSYAKYVYLIIKSSLLTEYCYMHFDNYIVEHIRGDMRWRGGGSSRTF